LTVYLWEHEGMARHNEFRVLVATDGSAHAREAIATTVRFPWPAHTQVRVVVARETRADYRRSILLRALDRNAEAAADAAQRALCRRWPDVEVDIVDKTPIRGILGEAERFGADLVVLGWRGHGPAKRLLLGSVSRGVARGAKCPVLVVRRRQRVTRIVVGFDGSTAAKRAIAFVGRLTAPRDGRVTLIRVLELIQVPTRFLLGRAALAREVRQTNTRRARTEMKGLNRAAAELKRGGWTTRSVLTHGEPLRDLLKEVGASRAHLLALGARSTSGLRRLLLGSVAEGALNRSPVAVLVVR
jgi:nucleotide-binding universal stress UspA family protein